MSNANTTDTFLTGANIDFLEAQYARYLEDPSSVDASFRELFATFDRAGRPIVTEGLAFERPRVANGNGAAQRYAPPGLTAELVTLQSKVDQTLFAFRLRGHLMANLDPLGIPRPALEHVTDLGLVSRAHFSDAELGTLVGAQTVFDAPRVPLQSLLERLRKTYTRHIGVEVAHLLNSERRGWLLRRMEHCDNQTDFTLQEQRRIFNVLAKAESFETTIHTKFQNAKRFSVEGAESLLPMIDAFLELGGALGIREVVIGMAHRGRLNVLTNICGKPADTIFSEFAGPPDPKLFLNRSDVKYHMGYSNDWFTSAGQKLHLTMAFNPSHLGVVHPVVEGRVRAKQDRAGEGAKHAIVPLVIHGDAAFVGQGLVAETLNLSGLKNYDVGGTVHIVVNNQIGYTTDAEDGRTGVYCTSQAQLLDIPVFHVNGDDAEACVHVMRLATEYRQRFHTDVVVDLVCYRKYGHNEGDEPRFTQPKMYEIISAKKTVRQIYGEQLAASGRFTAAEVDAMYQAAVAGYSESFTVSKSSKELKDPSSLAGIWSRFKGGPDKDVAQPETGVAAPRLKGLLEKLATLPEGFVLHPNVQKGVIEKRQRMLRGEEPIDWGTGEMLAYASLVTEGFAVRVSGQDTERGTFAHRHAVLHDTKTGRTAFPLGALGQGQARAQILNSPLSEMACMGFEFGYSLDYPDALVAWEAQFGDFANNGQVMIDQFIAAAEDKWMRLSGLTLLLPHGYEGAGPEHSSARLERFLDLAAEDNLQVCYPTNAAQIFHLLRRQVVRTIRKPLIVMTPKSLLRLGEAAAPFEALTSGRFQKLLTDPSPTLDPKRVDRVLLCSGKVAFALLQARDAAKDEALAILRVEQLYPFPEAEVTAALASFPNLKEVLWVQEEPKNVGAWRTLLEPLTQLTAALKSKPTLRYCGRVESASPATGFLKTHEYEQKLLVEEAVSRGNNVR